MPPKKHDRGPLRRAVVLIAALCVAVGLCRAASQAYRQAMLFFYPQKYQTEVTQWAENYGVDPLLIDAVICTESGFDAEAQSNVGARGLMQITEETFVWIKSKIAADEELTFDDLYDPAVNIRFGTYYVAACLNRYSGDVATAAAAYHSGWGTVDRLLADGVHSADGCTLESFPYTQMQNYVRKIAYHYEKYQQLYADEAA